jgi:predicted RNA binding protein YcfA (HicA-like mRNA interferase family)
MARPLLATSAVGDKSQTFPPEIPGLVTVAGKPGDDLAPGTLNRILKQADLKK